jgi:hypothetical protein
MRLTRSGHVFAMRANILTMDGQRSAMMLGGQYLDFTMESTPSIQK